MKVVLGTPERFPSINKLGYSYIGYNSVDCITFEYRRRSSTWFDRKNKVILRSIDGEQGALDIVLSDTSFSDVANFVCD